MSERTLSAAIALTADALVALVGSRESAPHGGLAMPETHMATWPGGIGETPDFGEAD